MEKSKCYSYIRFSSPEQSKGDSLRRQLALAKDYAQKNNLILDEELSLRDLGLSAFSGAHRKRGNLGDFLGLVKLEKIPKGSVLIVESLDRLSREQVLDAFEQFNQIIRNGIKIVTLTDGMEYCQETLSANVGQLMFSIMIMSRSHEESLQKSRRLKSAWQEKRKNLKDIKLTSICPAWMSLSDDKKEFIVKEDRVALVNRIFQMSKSGYGLKNIAKTLNQEGVSSWRKSSGWHGSYIHKILRNRAVLGEFQPHTKEEGKRVPDGDPVLGYFPKIVEEDLFYQVQNRLKSNAKYSGKTGKVSNLLGGLAKCAYCGSSMQFVNKGKPPKGGVHLVCDSARRGRGCDYLSYRYDEIEKAILTFCKEVDLVEVFSEKQDNRTKLIDDYKKIIDSKKEQLLDLKNKKNNLLNALSEADDEEFSRLIKDKIKDLMSEEDEAKNTKKITVNRLNQIQSEILSAKEKINDINSYYEQITKLDEVQVIDARFKIRSNLRSLIERIEVYPVGRRTSREVYEKVLELTLASDKEEGKCSEEETVNRVRQALFIGVNDKSQRLLTIKFKSGKILQLAPAEGGKYEYQIDVEIDGEHIFARAITDPA
jgi:DNA invertase Pin-like site-specific DNA recombinase